MKRIVRLFERTFFLSLFFINFILIAPTLSRSEIPLFTSNYTTFEKYPSICTTYYHTTEIDYVPYTDYYRGIFGIRRSVINYRLEKKSVWKPITQCCKGYESTTTYYTLPFTLDMFRMYPMPNMNHDLNCVPQCNNTCINGNCTKPNQCSCNIGYTKSISWDFICEPVCNPACIHGTCSSPNVCTCSAGFTLNVDNFTCIPKCSDRPCSEFEYCAAPNECKCVQGYTRVQTNNTQSEHSCEPICDPQCINGKCIAPNVCTCDYGFEKINPFICEIRCDIPCEFGKCWTSNVCTCNDGYIRNNETNSCVPVCNETCINGFCLAPDVCHCLNGYVLRNSPYFCEPTCYPPCENGVCTEPNVCKCNPNYVLNTEKNTCEKCNCDNGYCNETGSCYCHPGYSLQHSTNSSYCTPICTNACINGTCINPEECECYNNYVFLNETTNVCVHLHDRCINGKYDFSERICNCTYGWEGEKCDIPTVCSIQLNDTSAWKFINFRDRLKVTEWNLAQCSEKCKFQINNETECYNTLDYLSFNISNVCILDVECNNITQAVFHEQHRNNYSSIAFGVSGFTVFLIVTASSILLFIKKQYRKMQELKLIQKERTDCLLEDEGNL